MSGKVKAIMERYKESGDTTYTSRMKAFQKDTYARSHILKIFTDGSCLGAHNSGINSGFGGWGYHSQYFDKTSGEQRVHKRTRYGSSYRATVSEMELTAIKKSLLNLEDSLGERAYRNGQKVVVHIVTDSLSTIRGLHNMDAIAEEKIRLDGIPVESRGIHVNHRLRELNLFQEIKEIFDNTPQMMALNTEWVRSHVLDDLSRAERPHPREADTFEEKQVIHNLYGNEVSDQQAAMGSIRAVQQSLNYFSRKFYNQASDPEIAYDAALSKTSRNFDNSFAAREKAIDYIALQPKNFLEAKDIVGLLGTEAFPEIEAARVNHSQRLGCTVDEVSDAYSQHCRDQGTNWVKESVMQRFIARLDSNDLTKSIRDELNSDKEVENSPAYGLG